MNEIVENTQETIKLARKQILADEGKENFLYKCTAGKLTIGVGYNIEDRGLSDRIITRLFNADVKRVRDETLDIFPTTIMTSARRAALMNMLFQLGKPGFLKFPKMIQAIKEGDWNKAADEALNSKWAREDTPARALRVASALREG